MKRLLSSLMIALATMVVLPAHADNPCRNLWGGNIQAGWIAVNGSISGDGKHVRLNANPGDVYTLSAKWSTPDGSNLIAISARDASNNNLQRWVNNGGINGNLSGLLTVTAPAGTSSLVFAHYSTEPTEIQLEQGSTATSYVPYNPLCETCDGTVTNYESATGTVTQSGTPTPTNPIDPVFYKQGNMILRKVGDYADSYDATTGKITRRVGVKVLDGSEGFRMSNAGNYANNPYFAMTEQVSDLLPGNNTNQKLYCNMLTSGNISSDTHRKIQQNYNTFFFQPSNNILTVADWKTWLAQQYAAGTPVTVYYPLAEAVEETVGTSYCVADIKIATTKYTEDAFAGLVATLNSAIDKVTHIVDDTVQQATEIGNLATTKQDRPDTDCPAGRKCLLIMGADNKPHWYLIQE